MKFKKILEAIMVVIVFLAASGTVANHLNTSLNPYISLCIGCIYGVMINVYIWHIADYKFEGGYIEPCSYKLGDKNET